ncbi:hypothetical protein [Anaeromyxobacter oryzae]|uniref:Uncharacterized protein n=1 Tax=Anaeromyxobacter oryzae TaxID=2918170 RepID=A0ABM7X0D4_9BACT|nr:hypothetical protein [Anaeromyxobacter oryzae]BDG05176.1 hypothetical protein AMOR_41720 [Anaeromyxobacter oryzae]
MKKEEKKPETRILARRLARPLTGDELRIVAGGMLMRAGAVSGSSSVRLADTWSGTGCPENDCDC